MSTTSSISIPLLTLAVVFAVGLSITRARTTQQLHEQVAELQRQIIMKDASSSRSTTTDYDHRFLSETQEMNGERQLCSCDSTSGFTYASDFGVVGDSHVDDTTALQAAIDSASSNDSGGIVVLPKGTFRIFEPLIVPAGVTVQGQGYGDSPLAISFDAGASVIAYCGTDYAVKLGGHAAGLRDLAVYDWPYGTDCENIQAAGGVLVEADATLLESVIVSNVFIYFFVGGKALSLHAKNSAGVAFGNYQNLRIRHAKIGISLQAEEGSFVNSNSFLAGGISGGDFDYGLIAEGPGACNDNKFYGMFIEPPDSDVTHVYVSGSKTNIKLHDVRLEATDKDLDKPIVIVDDSSYGNVMNGFLGHTHVQANFNRNPDIDLMSHKSVGLDAAPKNLYWNSAFKGYNADDRMMPGFFLDGTNADISILEDEMLFPDHNVIHVDKLNYGDAFKLMADVTPQAPIHDFVTFGVYARSSVAGSISAAMRYESGSIISSASHSGGGDWEFIGMTALYDKSAPYFYFSITGDVDLTAPTFIYGQSPALPGASLMSSSGARMSGTLTMGVTTVYPPPPDSEPYYWVIPKNSGNIFLIDTQGDPSRTIIRLNHRTADRFARGTLATLMFEEAGTRVRHNAYIKLKNNSDFVSGPNTSITLMAGGSASWVEVSRNE